MPKTQNNFQRKKILSTDDDKWSANEIETENQQQTSQFWFQAAFIRLINRTDRSQGIMNGVKFTADKE